MRSFLVIVAGLIAAFLVGLLVFNSLVMPRFVQQGETVDVPALVGLGLEEAQASCVRAGLHLRVEDKRHAAGVPEDQVLAQFPESGASVKPGRTVRVHVSLGAEAVDLPDVRGLSLRQATLQLENANLAVGRIARVYEGHDGTSANGPVVQAMRPRPGEAVPRGGKVDLVVAEGGSPEPYLMPDLTGRSLEEVRQRIEEQGFRVGRITYRRKAGTYPGTVLEHMPPAGALVLRGESIELVASTPD